MCCKFKILDEFLADIDSMVDRDDRGRMVHDSSTTERRLRRQSRMVSSNNNISNNRLMTRKILDEEVTRNEQRTDVRQNDEVYLRKKKSNALKGRPLSLSQSRPSSLPPSSSSSRSQRSVDGDKVKEKKLKSVHLDAEKYKRRQSRVDKRATTDEWAGKQMDRRNTQAREPSLRSNDVNNVRKQSQFDNSNRRFTIHAKEAYERDETAVNVSTSTNQSSKSHKKQSRMWSAGDDGSPGHDEIGSARNQYTSRLSIADHRKSNVVADVRSIADSHDFSSHRRSVLEADENSAKRQQRTFATSESSGKIRPSISSKMRPSLSSLEFSSILNEKNDEIAHNEDSTTKVEVDGVLSRQSISRASDSPRSSPANSFAYMATHSKPITIDRKNSSLRCG